MEPECGITLILLIFVPLIHWLCIIYGKVTKFLLEVLYFGNGNGFSVQEVVSAVRTSCTKEGWTISVEYAQRWPVDPASFLADGGEAWRVLGRQPHLGYVSALKREVKLDPTHHCRVRCFLKDADSVVTKFTYSNDSCSGDFLFMAEYSWRNLLE